MLLTATQVSSELLLAVKSHEPYQAFVKSLAQESPKALQNELVKSETKLAFWINSYNAFVQILLAEDPGLFGQKNRFFQSKPILIAGQALSLDDIEHGILRGSRFKYGFGYLPKLFPSLFEKTHRLDRVDPRIHFALNCAASSCPPISVYEADKIYQQLDTATLSYLEKEVEYDPNTNTLYLPRILYWFRGDFGGHSGIRKFIQVHGLWPEAKRVRIRFREYDWTQLSHNFE